MSTYTPGPWIHTNHIDEERFADMESKHGHLYIRAQWGAMPRLPKGAKKILDAEMLANARLIAAAPDLLEMVGKLMRVIEDGISDVVDIDIYQQAKSLLQSVNGEKS